MIRVGISYNPNESLFYSGLNQTAVLFAELFSSLKHDLKYDVTLVDYTNGTRRIGQGNMVWMDGIVSGGFKISQHQISFTYTMLRGT